MKIKQGYKQTDIGIIPEDWEVKTLSQIANFENGKAHEQFIDDMGNWVVVNSKFISTEGQVAKFSKFGISPLKVGNIAIVMSDIPNGKALAKCFLVKESDRYTLNQRIGAIIANENIDNGFLYYKLNRNEYFLSFDSGSGQTNLRKNEIEECPLALPPTKPEQQAIAQTLSDIDSLIEALDKKIVKKRAIKEGAMQQLLTGKKRLEGFSEEGVERKLDSIGKTYGGLTGKTKNDFGVGNCKYIPFLNILNNPKIDTDFLEVVNVRNGEQQNRVQSGDLFFNTSSETPEEVGICSVLLDNVENLYLNSFCFGYRIQDDEVSGLYLSYFFRSKKGRELMTALAQGATRYNLSKSLFNSLTLSLPSTKKEQQSIAQILTDMDNEIEQLEKERQKYTALKQGAMQKLLTGEIRLLVEKSA